MLALYAGQNLRILGTIKIFLTLEFILNIGSLSAKHRISIAYSSGIASIEEVRMIESPICLVFKNKADLIF